MKLIWGTKQFRVVKTEHDYIVEQSSRDALGMSRWTEAESFGSKSGPTGQQKRWLVEIMEWLEREAETQED